MAEITVDTASQARLHQKLKSWRNETASQNGWGGKDIARVCCNDALEAVSRTRPSTIPELLRCKGIGPAKANKYGAKLLQIVSSCSSPQPSSAEGPSTPQQVPNAHANANSPWTSDHIRQLLVFAKQGDSPKVIAALLGRSTLGVTMKLEQLRGSPQLANPSFHSSSSSGKRPAEEPAAERLSQRAKHQVNDDELARAMLVAPDLGTCNDAKELRSFLEQTDAPFDDDCDVEGLKEAVRAQLPSWAVKRVLRVNKELSPESARASALLQLEQGKADDKAISVALKKLSLLVHPDKNKTPGAKSAFIALKKAAEELRAKL